MRLAITAPKRRKIRVGDELNGDERETTIEGAILLAVNSLPYARLWRNKERIVVRPDGSRARMPGLAKGSCDLVGVVTHVTTGHGVFVAIEVKQVGKKPKPEQYEWMRFVESFGGVADWTDNVQDALRIVERARCLTLSL